MADRDCGGPLQNVIPTAILNDLVIPAVANSVSTAVLSLPAAS